MTLNSQEKLSNKPEQDQLPIIIISIVIIIYIILLIFLIKYFLNKSLAKEKHYNEYFKKLKKIKKKKKH
jgi:predicted permease